MSGDEITPGRGGDQTSVMRVITRRPAGLKLGREAVVSSMQKPTISRDDPESRRAYSRWHYRQNKPAYKRRAKQKDDQVRNAVRDYLVAFLSENPCVDCGESDPIVLDFDHRDGELKSFNIGDARRSGYSLASVQSEVAKCDIRCANCHRRITYRRGGFRSRHID